MAERLFDIVTLFPKYFDGALSESIMGRAQEEGFLEFRLHNLRDWTHDKHKTVDDKPFGGGAGMVLKPEPLFECVEEIGQGAWKILLDPQGEPFTQELALRLSEKKHLLLIAGHYEGVDYRVHEHLIDQKISIGDFVTMGGEAPALCLIEAVSRLVPGVLGNEVSISQESFSGGLLEYPQYTRPRDFRGWQVPDVLCSGDHEKIKKWRKQEAEKTTQRQRPDLFNKE